MGDLSNNANDEFMALSNGTIDVLSGGRLNLANDVLEGTTGEGFTFTQSYFYMPTEDKKDVQPIGLVTREDDAQWSSFVYFVVTSTFYAEEIKYGSDKFSSFLLPDVADGRIFGDEFKDMFYHVVGAVGNYGGMYERNVEKIYPRNGTRNELNGNPFGPQHFPLPL